MTGEERSQRIRDDFLTARLIAAAIQDRRGRPRKEHPLFSEPEEVAWNRNIPDRPIFLYGDRGAFRICGERKSPYLVEAVIRGPIAVRKFFDPLGRLHKKDAQVEGNAAWN